MKRFARERLDVSFSLLSLIPLLFCLIFMLILASEEVTNHILLFSVRVLLHYYDSVMITLFH